MSSASTPHLTLNFGLRYEVNTPYTDIRNRMNAWDPGINRTVYPQRAGGLLFPGDPGVPAGIANVDYKEFMPRIGLAWDPFGDNKTTVGRATASSTTVSPTAPEVRSRPPSALCRGPRRTNCPAPDSTSPIPTAAPLAFRHWDISSSRPRCSPCNRACARPIRRIGISPSSAYRGKLLLDIRYVGNKGTHLPRFIEANPTSIRASTQTTTRSRVHNVQRRGPLQLRIGGN
jgi:hypothetical protein